MNGALRGAVSFCVSAVEPSAALHTNGMDHRPSRAYPAIASAANRHGITG
jgi:hypothetical protein